MSDAFNFYIHVVSQSNIVDTALLLSFPNEHIFYHSQMTQVHIRLKSLEWWGIFF